MNHQEHEGHWECQIKDASTELYEAARFAEWVMISNARTTAHDFALFRLRRAIAKAEGRPTEDPVRDVEGLRAEEHG